MVLSNKKVEKYLHETGITLLSLKEDLPIKEKIVSFGHTEERLDMGIQLFKGVESVYHELLGKRGEQAKLSFSVKEKFAEVSKTFSFYVDVFKTALHDTPGSIKELGLEGKRKASIPAFLTQAGTFYSNVKVKEHILAEVTAFEVTAEKMQKEWDKVSEVRDLHQQLINLIGECQRLTVDRDEKLAELRRYMHQLKAILFMLFENDNHQTLERIGIFVRNRPKPKPSEEENGGGETPEPVDTGQGYVPSKESVEKAAGTAKRSNKKA
jgi:hypothetical protein